MNKTRIVLVSVLLLAAVQMLFAFQFTPITKDFDSSGAGARQTFRITNDTDKTIGVQINAFTREMDLYGEEKLEDASNLFYIYPRQVVVQPGAYQTIRVQWRGPAVTDTEIPFRIEAQQLPLNFTPTEGGASLNILLVYRGTMYVLPQELQYDLDLLSVSPHTTEDGKKMIAIEMKNNGNTHQIMYQPRFTITSRSASGSLLTRVDLEGEQLKGLAGENILAGKRRIFLVPWPQELQEGNLDATFQMENVR
jgi:fimbrial chaperone protein